VLLAPQLGTLVTPYCCSALVGLKVSCSEQPSIEVAETVEAFALDGERNLIWIGAIYSGPDASGVHPHGAVQINIGGKLEFEASG